MALIIVFQFYDPQLRCFTFQDYQLVPTLEEYSNILNIQITDDDVPFVRVPKVVRFEKIAEALHLGIKEVERNWTSSGAIPGFYLCFLISKAEEVAKKERWDDLGRLLAIMIYGIVLFPSLENFVSLSAICVFMNKKAVPTLLAETYFAIHSRNGKGGYVGGFCHSFYRWFMLHLPVKGPFVLKKSSLRWSDRLVYLTSYDVRWNYWVGKVWNIITSCGQYSNVPLIGTRGCISYNPTLAYRQLGYAMEGSRKDVEAFELVYFADGKNPMELEKIASAWTKVHRRDQITLRKKVPIAMGPYMDWVKPRAKDLLLPFVKSDPLYEQPPVILSDTVFAELYTQAKADNIKLQAKDREVDLENYFRDQEKADLARKLKQAEGEGSSMARAQRCSYELMERKLYQKQQECLKLQKSESSGKRKMRDLEKQLVEEKAKSARLEEELARLRTQRR
ncbi:uncharacterized protein LOC131630120 [Vicia villosa]|uniref:uncharacterized protein LOC131630120 n=1 Tax=Vicia villosa TaxID=3911 RepID=UPI00273B35E7|nr:uncharacterized protein LOC131630120 [Vicia villosa]